MDEPFLPRFYAENQKNIVFLQVMKSLFAKMSLTVLLLWIGFSMVKATVWNAQTLPMVHLQDRTRYVCDPDGLLSPAARTQADLYLDSLRRGLGVQSVFVVVRQVKNGDTFRMAQDIGNQYGVGDKTTRRGLVIVIAVDDKRYTLAPGKGLEGELTDVVCDRIARRALIPAMREGNLDRAVVSTAATVLMHLKTGKVTLQNDEDPTNDNWVLIIMLLIIFFGVPVLSLIQWLLMLFGIIKKPWFNTLSGKPRNNHDNDNFIPPFIFGGGGGFGRGGGGSFGGNFGGGSFGGGGSSGGW